jgi:hypothetical protein
MKSPAKRLLNSVPYQPAYNRLIKNREVFETLLRAQPIAPPGWSDIGITIGNPLATNTIIKVCNTHCTHCANAHLVLRRIVDKNSDCNLRIIFTPPSETDDKRRAVIERFLAISSFSQPALITEALDRWYSNNETDHEFLSRELVVPKGNDFHAAIEAMKLWCSEAQITHTPAIFVNGHQLPDQYDLNHLAYILQA